MDDNSTAMDNFKHLCETLAEPTGISPELLLIAAVFAMLLGVYLGIVMSRPSIPRSRVRHRALRAYQDHPDAKDPLVASLLRREIRSIEIRLGEDNDQD